MMFLYTAQELDCFFSIISAFCLKINWIWWWISFCSNCKSKKKRKPHSSKLCLHTRPTRNYRWRSGILFAAVFCVEWVIEQEVLKNGWWHNLMYIGAEYKLHHFTLSFGFHASHIRTAYHMTMVLLKFRSWEIIGLNTNPTAVTEC